jgi:hypothetical protein
MQKYAIQIWTYNRVQYLVTFAHLITAAADLSNCLGSYHISPIWYKFIFRSNKTGAVFP